MRRNFLTASTQHQIHPCWACFLGLALTLTALAAKARTQQTKAQELKTQEALVEGIRITNLPLEFGPGRIVEAEQSEADEAQWLRSAFKFRSVMSFHVPDESGKQLWSDRLAIFSYVRPAAKELAGKYSLRIFKLEHEKLVSDFSLDLVDNQPGWEEIVSFPSAYYKLPGIVIWGGEDVSHAVAKVVAYVDGKFQVVFDEGYNIELIDLDFDGIPEVISGDVAGSPSVFQVWTWTGQKYVPVAHVPKKEIFSPEVIEAVKAAKSKPAERSGLDTQRNSAAWLRAICLAQGCDPFRTGG